MKSVFVLLVFFLVQGAWAQGHSELGRSSKGQNTLQIGSYEWVKNLCKRITAQGIPNEVIWPLSKAIETCPERRYYVENEEAYAKLKAPVNCSVIDLKKEEMGTICVTTKGGQFMAVANGIQDLVSGLVIMNEIIGNVSYHEARDYCSRKGKRLPTKEEFEASENRGLRQAFREDMKGKFFWTSSIHPDSSKAAFVFNGNDGFADYLNVIGWDFYSSTRCVSGTDVN